jgi:WD40 repeat protein
VSSTRKDRGGDYTQFGIWRMESGAQIHELWPYERRGQRPAAGLRWTADGHYVLAGLYPLLDDSNVIGVFNASTGRQSGAFTGCFRLDGLAFGPDETQLFAGCADGKIRIWDFQAALKQVREFEAVAGPARR